LNILHWTKDQYCFQLWTWWN